MSAMALRKSGLPLFPDELTEREWSTLKESYAIGDFVMPCCEAPAIPKTSPNGLPFFSHYSDECSTSPESVWHVATKELIARHLLALNIEPYLEMQGGGGTWKADVHFTHEGRNIAIEVQHSHQTLQDYLTRQKRYKLDGVECYWLLYPKRYMTLARLIGKYRLKRDFGGKYPEEGHFTNCIPELPVVLFELKDEIEVVKGANFFELSLRDWLIGLVEKKFCYHQGNWVVV